MGETASASNSPLAAHALLTPRAEGGPCHEAGSGGSSGSLKRRIVPIFTDVTHFLLRPLLKTHILASPFGVRGSQGHSLPSASRGTLLYLSKGQVYPIKLSEEKGNCSLTKQRPLQ